MAIGLFVHGLFGTSGLVVCLYGAVSTYSVVQYLSAVQLHLFLAICLLPSAFCPLPFVLCLLPSAFRPNQVRLRLCLSRVVSCRVKFNSTSTAFSPRGTVVDATVQLVRRRRLSGNLWIDPPPGRSLLYTNTTQHTTTHPPNFDETL